jgi:hypothetical protein
MDRDLALHAPVSSMQCTVLIVKGRQLVTGAKIGIE